MARCEYFVTEMCVMTVVPSLVLVKEVILPHMPGSGSLPLSHDHTPMSLTSRDLELRLDPSLWTGWTESSLQNFTHVMEKQNSAVHLQLTKHGSNPHDTQLMHKYNTWHAVESDSDRKRKEVLAPTIV